ncbi:hypothetical protein [Microcoleus sp. B3-D7]|uniref:hypothetical protein n=1 Tax=Microcoleus sp. B3-D7 TaxID=2818659 RepID=UPI002FD4C937
MKVFFTGTENLQDFTPEIVMRIFKVTQLNAEILISNYRGFDQLTLGFLYILEYPKVTVSETGSNLTFGYPIVNVGQYPAPDIAMSEEADFMLAVCDGKSPRVTANLQRMPKNRIRLIRL